jgi:pimeloyl-ACP methyl ester carboxylesterase
MIASVKITAEDLRKRYAEMPDEALLSLDRNELVDLARECYDQEVARRGLKRRRPAAPVEAEEPEPAAEVGVEEPVSAGIFRYPDEVAIARDLLRAERVPCYLEVEHLIYSSGSSGARLMVPAAFLDRAREILAESSNEMEPPEPWDGEVAHRLVETNGIRMHIAEAGSGPLVVLLHGFPESWNSWRHQLEALAAEGYRVVAPDLRGYGQTDRPEAVEAYDIFQLAGDMVGLVNGLGGAPAVVVGHDWGAWIAPHCALLRPDLFRAVALLSVPFVPRRAVNETQWEEQKYPGKVFYQATLRSPMAEQFFGTDVRARLLAGLWALSGDVPREKRWKPVRDQDAPPLLPAVPSGLPRWLAEEDLNALVGEYQRTGFTGGLNYYRNMDRNWSLTPFLDGAKLLQRTLFLAGAEDPVLEFLDEEFADLDVNVPNLWKKVLIPRAGHWIQQERPDEVNRVLIEFLGELEAGERAQ